MAKIVDTREFDKKIKAVQLSIRRLPAGIAVMAVNFSKDRFRKQNWLDDTPEKWKKRKYKDKSNRTNSRAILVRSGRLKRSIRKISISPSRVIIGSDLDYASIHNFGGDIKGTFNVSGHGVRQHVRRRKGRKQIVKEHAVRSHSRTVDTAMPKRQFLGNSEALRRELLKYVQTQIKNALKQ